METINITLLMLNIISFILHGLHFSSKCRVGNDNTCCRCDGTLEENLDTKEIKEGKEGIL